MKAILAVVAALLAVTHVGDTQGDHTPKPPFREPLVVVCVFASSNSLFYLHNITGELAVVDGGGHDEGQADEVEGEARENGWQ